VSFEEGARYLAAARNPLASVGAVLVDTGMRPEECYRLRWEAVTWVNGRNGTLLVTHGKTEAARRVLPMTPGVRGNSRRALEWRWPATRGLDLGCPYPKWSH
jgi:integrase